ncbi:hypothetical protein V5D56_04675 [Cellulosimicrobium sp. PMB13]|uniref:hypothetical protein n=1 Tax=Cellulosimicrobium sp. PMB13 TaxID=3120158 RepID=UPI003F4C74CD
MNADGPAPAAAGTDDDFVVRLRRAADAAVPESRLDLDVSLRTSRRKARARRALTATASVLAVAGVGTAAAVGAPALSGLSDLLVADAPYEVVVPEATTVDVAPGIVAVSEPATYLRDDGTYVLDLGLGAWADGERFLAEVDEGGPDGRSLSTLRVVAGDDDDLAALRRGEDAGTVVLDDFTNGSLVLGAGTGTGESVYVGLDGTSSERSGSDGRSTWLVLAGETTDATGERVTSVEVPTARFGDLVMVAARLGADGVDVPELRGHVSVGPGLQSSADCADAPEELPEGEERIRGCRVAYDAERRTVTEVDAPPGVLDNAVMDALRGLLPPTPDRAPHDPALLVACLAQRGFDVPRGDDAVLWTMPDGAQGQAWRQCQLDVPTVVLEWYTTHADEVQGKELTSGWD